MVVLVAESREDPKASELYTSKGVNIIVRNFLKKKFKGKSYRRIPRSLPGGELSRYKERCV